MATMEARLDRIMHHFVKFWGDDAFVFGPELEIVGGPGELDFLLAISRDNTNMAFTALRQGDAKKIWLANECRIFFCVNVGSGHIIGFKSGVDHYIGVYSIRQRTGTIRQVTTRR